MCLVISVELQTPAVFIPFKTAIHIGLEAMSVVSDGLEICSMTDRYCLFTIPVPLYLRVPISWLFGKSSSDKTS